MLFCFLSNIIYFETIFDYDVTMKNIDNCLRDSILVGFSHNIMEVEPLFRCSYFQVVTSIMRHIRSGRVSCYTSLYVCCTFCDVGGTVLPHLLMGENVP